MLLGFLGTPLRLIAHMEGPCEELICGGTQVLENHEAEVILICLHQDATAQSSVMNMVMKQNWNTKLLMNVAMFMVNKGKCQAPHLRKNSPMHRYMLQENWLENGFTEKHLSFLMGAKLSVRQQRALTTSVESAASSPGLLHTRQTWTYWTVSSERPQT